VTFAGRVPAPHLLVAALCCGLSASLAVRSISASLALSAVALASVGVVARRARAAWLAVAMLLAGLWWGGQRLAGLDESVLAGELGTTAMARVEVTGPPRTGPFSVRVPVRVELWDDRVVDEAARLQLPRGRSPPQGAILEVVASAREPRPAEDGERFDERAYLRRQGVHVVLRASAFRIVGRRGGVGGLADRLRAQVARTMAPGLDGERRAVVAGIVLGEDEGLDADLQDAFRASGLYHLLSELKSSTSAVVLRRAPLPTTWARVFHC
jgi:predicted membrane metal-binding protein